MSNEVTSAESQGAQADQADEEQVSDAELMLEATRAMRSRAKGQIAELSEARAANEAPAQERHGLASVHHAPVEVRGAKGGGA